MPFLEPLSDKDIADALSAASSVGDDRIQAGRDRAGSTRNRGRTAPPSSGRSGSPSATRPAIRTSATPSPPTTLGRRPTAVDAVAERYLDTFAALDPCAATELGITGHDDDITDYSPDGVAARADAARAALRELDGVDPADDVDAVTIAAMRERLGVQIELHDAGLDVGELNVIASPLQTMRDVFDLMATDTDDDWALISRRLSPAARPCRRLRRCAAGRGGRSGIRPPSARSTAASSRPARSSSCSSTWSPTPRRKTLPLHAELQQRAAEAADAYRHARRRAARRHRRRTPGTEDAFGRDAYRLLSRAFLGATVDLDETYQWGLHQLENIVAEQESIARPALSRVVGRRGAAATGRRAPLRRARHRRAAGLDAGPVRPCRGFAGRQAFRHRRSRCAAWNAGSRRRRPAASTTPARRRI